MDSPEVKVTFAHPVELPAPVQIQGATVLETGADAVWFTFPGRWHDIGRFHTRDGRFTGIYANVLTPPEIVGREWFTTDLFLDVWLGDGAARAICLDREELEEALAAGWVGREDADRAEREASEILEAHRSGEWPPDVVHEWTRERALLEFSR